MGSMWKRWLAAVLCGVLLSMVLMAAAVWLTLSLGGPPAGALRSAADGRWSDTESALGKSVAWGALVILPLVSLVVGYVTGRLARTHRALAGIAAITPMLILGLPGVSWLSLGGILASLALAVVGAAGAPHPQPRPPGPPG